MSRSIVIIGGTGEGKSTKALELIKQLNEGKCIVYDYRGEKQYQHLSTDLNTDKCRFTGKPEVFLKVVAKKIETTVLFEEATIFFKGQMGEDVRDLLVSKRHKKQVIIFLFHTINSVPPFILDMADYFFLKKTGDDEGRVRRKASKLLPYFLRLQRMPKYSTLMIKNF